MQRLLAILLLCGAVAAQTHTPRRPTRYHVRATAFCLHGVTAAGTRSHTGTVAADPDFLPMGTSIRIHNAGVYSGVYEVTDTGKAVKGRHIDLRLETPAAARRFGNRMVWVEVLKWGDGDVKDEARVRPPGSEH
jgi:3D (Asp-Asp-Asp) domain-containing protein